MRILRVRLKIIRNARIKTIGNYELCMFSKLRLSANAPVYNLVDSDRTAKSDGDNDGKLERRGAQWAAGCIAGGVRFCRDDRWERPSIL